MVVCYTAYNGKTLFEIVEPNGHAQFATDINNAAEHGHTLILAIVRK